MFDLKQKLVAVMIGCLLSVGVVGQKRDTPRPPKDDNKVVVTPKQPRPPQNSNSQPPKRDDNKRGKQ